MVIMLAAVGGGSDNISLASSSELKIFSMTVWSNSRQKQKRKNAFEVYGVFSFYMLAFFVFVSSSSSSTKKKWKKTLLTLFVCIALLIEK